jgi:hypothetical protein
MNDAASLWNFYGSRVAENLIAGGRIPPLWCHHLMLRRSDGAVGRSGWMFGLNDQPHPQCLAHLGYRVEARAGIGA